MIFAMAQIGYILDYLALTLVIFLNLGNTHGITNCHFENSYGCTEGLPREEDAIEGWRVHRERTNSFAFVSCQSSCNKHVTILRGMQSMQPSKWSVNFCYFLATIDGAIDTRNVQLRVIACGNNKTVSLSRGSWQSESVRITCNEPFSVGFEVHFSSGLQRLALDQVTVRDQSSKLVSTVCSDVEPSLFELYPAIIETPITSGRYPPDAVTPTTITQGAYPPDAETTTPIPPGGYPPDAETPTPITPGGYPPDYQGNDAETPVYAEESYLASESIPVDYIPIIADESAVVSEANVSVLIPKKPFASEKTTPTDEKPGQKFFNNVLDFFKELMSNPLLLAEVLAIATVAICCMTITIHCFIWRKQRNSYRFYRDDSFRAQRYLAKNLSNSDMLLDMTVHDSCSESDFGPISRSRSSSKATPPVDRAKLKATKHLSDRRSTMTCGNGLVSGPDSEDEAKPRPHPRTKSLPSRPPINYYETIDEVRKNALQPVQEGDVDESRSRSLPSLVDSHPAPVPPKNKRSGKSGEKRKHKKHKRQARKRSKNEMNVKETVVIDSKENKKLRKRYKNQMNVKETIMIDAKVGKDTTYENCAMRVNHSHGVYDKLGRESQTHPEIICDVCITDNGKKRKGRFSLQVDSRGTHVHSPKKVQFRPRSRSLSQEESVEESNDVTSPSLAEQNSKPKFGVNKVHSNSEERPYFTLEPIDDQPQNKVDHVSSSELSDEVISGSVDTLQEQKIIANNHTDSFKRSVNNDQCIIKPNSLIRNDTVDTYETYEIGSYDNFVHGKKFTENDLSGKKLTENGLPDIGPYDNFVVPKRKLSEKELSSTLTDNGSPERELYENTAVESPVDQSTVDEIFNDKNADHCTDRPYQTLEPHPIQNEPTDYQTLEPPAPISNEAYQTLEPPVQNSPIRRKSKETYF